MGCCGYLFNAIAVGLIAYAAHYGYKEASSKPDYGPAYALPDWWWKARLPDTVSLIDASDAEGLKKVLFGGDPWLLQCYSGLPFAGQHLPRPYRVHPAFKDALGSMGGGVRGGLIDCEARLPSNKSVVQKLGLVRRTQPLLVLANGGAAPKQLPSSAAASAQAISAWVAPKAEPRVLSIGTQKTFAATCGGKRPCLLAHLDADSGVLEALSRRFRTLEASSPLPGTSAAASRPSSAPGRARVGCLARRGRRRRIARVGPRRGDWRDARGGRGSPLWQARLAPPRRLDTARGAGALLSLLGTRRRRVSLLLPDPDDLAERVAAKKAGNQKAARRAANPPRLLRGYEGDEDVPSLSAFVQEALRDAGSAVRRDGTDAFMRTPLPTLSRKKRAGDGAGKGEGKAGKAGKANDNAEVQARRAKARKEKAEAEAAAAAERAAAEARARGESEAEMQKRREAARREQMQREQERADNLVEEADDEDEDEDEDEEEEDLEVEDFDA